MVKILVSLIGIALIFTAFGYGVLRLEICRLISRLGTNEESLSDHDKKRVSEMYAYLHSFMRSMLIYTATLFLALLSYTLAMNLRNGG